MQTTLTEDEREISSAYWQVARTLMPVEIRQTILRDIEKVFCSHLSSSPERAGKILASALNEIEWDWPKWHRYAETEDLDSLPLIDAECTIESPEWVERRKMCRLEMAKTIAMRVSRIVHHLERYRQLSDPQLLQLTPNWKFICGDSCTNECLSLNNMSLPAATAIRTFPSLPCDYLECRCRIAATVR